MTTNKFAPANKKSKQLKTPGWQCCGCAYSGIQMDYGCPSCCYDKIGSKYPEPTPPPQGIKMIDFSISSIPHSESFTELGSNFHVIRKPVKPYGTGAHALVPIEHLGKNCIVVVLED